MKQNFIKIALLMFLFGCTQIEPKKDTTEHFDLCSPKERLDFIISYYSIDEGARELEELYCYDSAIVKSAGIAFYYYGDTLRNYTESTKTEIIKVLAFNYKTKAFYVIDDGSCSYYRKLTVNKGSFIKRTYGNPDTPVGLFSDWWESEHYQACETENRLKIFASRNLVYAAKLEQLLNGLPRFTKLNFDGHVFVRHTVDSLFRMFMPVPEKYDNYVMKTGGLKLLSIADTDKLLNIAQHLVNEKAHICQPEVNTKLIPQFLKFSKHALRDSLEFLVYTGENTVFNNTNLIIVSLYDILGNQQWTKALSMENFESNICTVAIYDFRTLYLFCNSKTQRTPGYYY